MDGDEVHVLLSQRQCYIVLWDRCLARSTEEGGTMASGH